MDSQIKDANYALLEGDRDGVLKLLGSRQDTVEAIWLRAHASASDAERLELLGQVVNYQDAIFSPLAAAILDREQTYRREIETPPGWQFWKQPRWQPFTRFISRYRIAVILILILLCAASIAGFAWITSKQNQNNLLAISLTETQLAAALTDRIDSTPTPPEPTSTIRPTPSITAIPPGRRITVAYPAGQVSLARVENPTYRLVAFQSHSDDVYATPAIGAYFAAFQLEFSCRLTLCTQPPEAMVSLKLDNGTIIQYDQYAYPMLADQTASMRVSTGNTAMVWFVFEIPTQRTPVALILSPNDGSQAMELPIRY